MNTPYTPYSEVLKSKGLSGTRIRKVTVNGGFTCPNLDGTKGRGGCTFCDNRSFSPVAGDRGLSITDQREKGTTYLRKRYQADKFIAYFQTFSGTYAPVERLETLYRQALEFPDVIGLSIGTRPDCLTPEIVALLEELGKKTFLTLELGLQSAFDVTLEKINRGHTFEEFARAMDLCSRKSFDLCVHVILGLPGETKSHFRSTAETLGRWYYQSIKIHPLHVVRGTVLEKQFLCGEYEPMEMETYISGVVDFLERIPSDVGVQRFTGDAPEAMLIAPKWCRNKFGIMEAMKSEFERRGTTQGWLLDHPEAVEMGMSRVKDTAHGLHGL